MVSRSKNVINSIPVKEWAQTSSAASADHVVKQAENQFFVFMNWLEYCADDTELIFDVFFGQKVCFAKFTAL